MGESLCIMIDVLVCSVEMVTLCLILCITILNTIKCWTVVEDILS